jgi:hypothetical protein
MSEANKRAVERYFAAMRTGDPRLPELLTEDVTWWVPKSSPLGGLHEGRAKVLALMGRGVELYDASTPMQIAIEQLVAEGEWVCAMLTIDARTAQGAPYHNDYHFAFRLRDGKICAVREYVDTLTAQRLLFDPR